MRSAGARMTRTRRSVSVPSGLVSVLAVVAPRVRVCGAALAAVVVVLGLVAMGSLLHVSGQGVERVLPEEAVLHEPSEGGRERPRLEGAAAHAAVRGLLEQPRLLQHPEVPGDGGQAHVVRRGEVAHGAVALRQPGDDAAPDGVGEGREDRVEVGTPFLNHLVNPLRGWTLNTLVNRRDARLPLLGIAPLALVGHRASRRTAFLGSCGLDTCRCRTAASRGGDGEAASTPGLSCPRPSWRARPPAWRSS